MTRHEVRLRGPFNPLPYSGLADSCERFFDYLIAVRQSAVFYNPDYIRDDPVAAQRLLGFRRDAVASILANLYVFAGALRAGRKVPVCVSSHLLKTPYNSVLIFDIAIPTQRRRSPTTAPRRNSSCGRLHGPPQRSKQCQVAQEMERHLQLLVQRESHWLRGTTRRIRKVYQAHCG